MCALSIRDRSLRRAAFLLFFVLPCVGCGGPPPGPELAPVEGTVTLDSQPLPDATVWFNPVGEGRSSTGRTDAQGRFVINYGPDKPGAMLGQHNVRITTLQQGGDENLPDQPKSIPEKVPKNYFKDGTLTADVKAGENNNFTFDLKSN
jgi:hypothetical protein